MDAFDDRRMIAVAKDRAFAEDYAVSHWINTANEAIKARGAFYVALSGGSTPYTIFRELSTPQHAKHVDWVRVHLFWSDERSVAPDNDESNYKMAMHAGLSKLPIPPQQIHRIVAEINAIDGANAYEDLILKTVPDSIFDLVMLGMGEDGHTASLFPHTDALKEESRLIAANYVPSKTTWRMTMTYPCINKSRRIVIYVLGESKAAMVEKVLKGPYQPDEYPIQKIGTQTNKAMWLMDQYAASKLHLRETACLF